jgi:hypothetical protein
VTAPALEVVASQPAPEWSLARRIAFRFAFVYLVLYSFPFPIGALPWTEKLAESIGHGWEKVIIWSAAHVLRMKTLPEAHPTGSGDTLIAWVGLLVGAIISALVMIVWSALSRRGEHRKLAGALRVYVRYVLAWTMLSYGFGKVFPGQFPANDPLRLMEPYGQLSPMGVVWAMMGASGAYTAISGIGEALGGILLLSRRTTTVGALLLLAVVGNVVLLNFCYDVPVKQYSVHLWLMALYLAWPDLRLLFDALVRRRKVQPAPVGWRLASRRWHITARVAKYAFTGWLVFANVSGGFESYREYGSGRTPKPIEGLWEVEDLSGGAPHWQAVGIGSFRGAVRTVEDPFVRYGVELDEKDAKLKLTDKKGALIFAYRQSDRDHLALDGPFVVKLRRVPADQVTLTSRGFHWIQEYPFNR